jgi:hypothetical protein
MMLGYIIGSVLALLFCGWDYGQPVSVFSTHNKSDREAMYFVIILMWPILLVMAGVAIFGIAVNYLMMGLIAAMSFLIKKAIG